MGPADARAWWLRASDGVRIRMALWPVEGARGTVLIFPGRTEYVEKYGQLARDMHAAGYAMVAVDWRGQGLADRQLDLRDIGHVGDFAEYQLDVAAVTAALGQISQAPRPWHLVGHSMGGAIGLRALYQGIDVDRVVFSAPMWGISMSPIRRLGAGLLGWLAGPLGVKNAFAPTTGPAKPGVFAKNRLTTDRAQFEYMEHQTQSYPDLALGGPSIRWVTAALAETSELMAMAPPPKPALGFLGTAERIVTKPAVQTRFATWPGARLEILDGAEHEVMMEAAPIRQRVLEQMLAWFEGT